MNSHESDHHSRTGFDEFLRQSRSGDQEAVGDLLSAYRHYLHLMARVQVDRRFAGKVEPSDLVQDTLFQAHRCFDQFRGTSERQLMAWLRQLLATQLAQQVRRFTARKRDPNLERRLHSEVQQSSVTFESQLAGPVSTPSQHAARREESARVSDTLASLPAHYREVIILRNLEQKEFAEIAQQLDRSVDATKKLWVRAIKKLRERLA